VDVLDSRVVYIGETCNNSLGGRLDEFHRSAFEGKAVHWVTQASPRAFGFLRSRWNCALVAVGRRFSPRRNVGLPPRRPAKARAARGDPCRTGACPNLLRRGWLNRTRFRAIPTARHLRLGKDGVS
jgi:hypothetical protein